VTSELREAFAGFDKEDIKRALMASANLFSRIACKTAGKLVYRYSMESDRKATEWIEECLAEKDKTRH
jgi:hypothetical protein